MEETLRQILAELQTMRTLMEAERAEHLEYVAGAEERKRIRQAEEEEAGRKMVERTAERMIEIRRQFDAEQELRYRIFHGVKAND